MENLIDAFEKCEHSQTVADLHKFQLLEMGSHTHLIITWTPT